MTLDIALLADGISTTDAASIEIVTEALRDAERIGDHDLVQYATVRLFRLVSGRSADTTSEERDRVRSAVDTLKESDERLCALATFFGFGLGRGYQQLVEDHPFGVSERKQYLGEALALVRRRKDSQLQARILERLGFIAYATGDIDAASDIADEALTLLDRTNQPGVTRTRTIVTAAKIAVSRGQLESALQLVREALAMTHRA